MTTLQHLPPTAFSLPAKHGATEQLAVSETIRCGLSSLHIRPLHAPHTPSAACITEGVVSELLRARRRGIRSDDPERSLALALAAPPEIADREQDAIVTALHHNVLFSFLSTDELTSLAKRMHIQQVARGERVVTRGEKGDTFFVVRSGRFNVLNDHGEVINRLAVGATFGELGLLYSATRTASVVADAKTPSSLYALQGKFFGYVAVRHSLSTYESSLDVLKKVTLLEDLTDEQLHTVANAVQPLHYHTGDVIVQKGEPGSVVYLLLAGSVVCTDIGTGASARSVVLREGGFFGERALLTNEPRSATVIAKSDVHVLALDCDTFLSLVASFERVLTATNVRRTIESVALFKRIPSSVKTTLLAAARVQAFAPDDVIVREGEVGDAFYIIKDGDVCVVQQQPSVVPVELARLGAGDWFGEIALLEQTRRTASVIAASRVECFVIDAALFTDLCAPMRDHLAQLAAHRVVVNHDRVFAQQITIASLERTNILGIGSYGIVYLAKHTPTGRIVAVKEMSKARLEAVNQVTHIRHERDVLETLADSNFNLKLYCTLQDDRRVLFVCEPLLGGELFQRIVTPQGAPVLLSQDHTRFYAACCIEALGYLHERSIAYRDVKPENILLDARGYAKLVDFGFAKKIVGKSFTLCGTPEYLAPESILGTGHGPAVDSWGLGVLLYELVVGDSPFASYDRMATCRNILELRITFPYDCDPDWKALVLALLQKDPSARASLIDGAFLDIRRFAWFSNVKFDWMALRKHTMAAPWTPTLGSAVDTTYFQRVEAPDLSRLEAYKNVSPTTDWADF